MKKSREFRIGKKKYRWSYEKTSAKLITAVSFIAIILIAIVIYLSTWIVALMLI